MIEDGLVIVVGLIALVFIAFKLLND